jgi:hypothetical protein
MSVPPLLPSQYGSKNCHSSMAACEAGKYIGRFESERLTEIQVSVGLGRGRSWGMAGLTW